MNLQAEEARIVRAVREEMLALQADLAAGASVEEGALTFDYEIRTVKRASDQAKNGGAPLRRSVLELAPKRTSV